MDANSNDIFEAARRLVSEHDRRKAEEEQRVLDAEREAMLRVFAQHVDTAFDFTSREKVELDPRMDVLEGRGVLEFIVRSHRAIFLLSEGAEGKWGLQAAEEDRPLELLAEIDGGSHADGPSRRLAAARIVTAIGDWADERRSTTLRPELVTPPAPAPAPAPIEPAGAAPFKAAPVVPLDRLPPAGNGHYQDPSAAAATRQRSDEDPEVRRRPAPPVPHFGERFGY